MSASDLSGTVQRFDRLYEFDRAPVSAGRLLGPGHFAGARGPAVDAAAAAPAAPARAAALLALAACLVMPWMVFRAGSEGYRDRLDSMRSWLVLPSAVYFIAGTIYYLRRETEQGRIR
jgi:hypothetical protein